MLDSDGIRRLGNAIDTYNAIVVVGAICTIGLIVWYFASRKHDNK